MQHNQAPIPQDLDNSIEVHSSGSDMPEIDMGQLAHLLVAGAKQNSMALTGEGGLLTDLSRQVLQTALEVEMTEHLGYERRNPQNPNPENYRNGHTSKTVKSEVGEVEIKVPRDRNGTFEPVTAPKHARRFDGLDEQVLSLYSKGMTTGDIRDYLSEIYDTKLSKDTISKITDAVIAEMRDWQSRPLDRVYPVVLIDGIYIKIRDGQVANRPVYVAMGIDCDGQRDVLGLWVGPTGGEGAKQWLHMLSDLKNRGVQDVCIVCCDGLKGLPASVEATWPEATVQTCVVHLIRNSLRLVPHKLKKELATDLKTIYTAPNEEAALQALEIVENDWGDKYPAMIASWKRAWPEFSPFLQFPPEVRKIIYTTNSIESLNARFRKAVRKRGHFPTEASALKVLYLAAVRKEPGRPNPNNAIRNWSGIYSALVLTYGDQLEMR
jgi:transposase-like protein